MRLHMAANIHKIKTLDREKDYGKKKMKTRREENSRDDEMRKLARSESLWSTVKAQLERSIKQREVEATKN